jgi:hypothetical protein
MGERATTAAVPSNMLGYLLKLQIQRRLFDTYRDQSFGNISLVNVK